MKKLCLSLVILFSAPIFAAKPNFTQTYDNIAEEECEGLYLDGVTYSFTIDGLPSGDCVAGTFVGPSSNNNLTLPLIEGSVSGTLHLMFDVPTTEISFGVAQNLTGTSAGIVAVNLYRPGVGILRDQVQLEISPDPLFLGGRYDYYGPAVKTITIQFEGDDFLRFAIDNLAHFLPRSRMK